MSVIFTAQNDVLLASPNPEAKSVVEAVSRDYETLQPDFERLGEKDFVYGVHPWDTNSVGHLHLHIFPREGKFRKYSAVRHDAKTVTMNDVLAAEKQERERQVREGRKKAKAGEKR